MFSEFHVKSFLTLLVCFARAKFLEINCGGRWLEMMWSEENLKEFEKWLIEQSLKGFIDIIVNALPDEPSTLSYFNHSNEISEPLLDAVVTFIARQIEIFAPSPDPVRSISHTTNDYSSLAVSKSERIDAWISV